MAEIDTTPSIVEAIYGLHKSRQTDWRRPRLGGSRIGMECSRALFLEFRWAMPPAFEGRILRLFDSGFREEARIIAELKALGIDVYDTDEETGRQIQFTAHGGHFGGSVDAVVKGLPDSPQKAHVLECKTMNKKHFDLLLKSCVEIAKPQHWAQMQCYMRGIGLDRALYIAVCKDDDRIYAERVHHDKEISAQLLDRAEKIIFGELPPASECEDCKYCQYSLICKDSASPMTNCRTCALSVPKPEGGWYCRKNNNPIPADKALWGCDAWVSITNPGVQQ